MMQRHFLWVLVALNVVAGAFFARHWVNRYGQPKPYGWVAPAPVLPEVVTVDGKLPGRLPPDPVKFASLQERPLFAASRRPPPPPPPPKAAVPVPVDPLASVHVFGLFAGDGGEGGALVRISGKVQTVVKGGKIGPWTVAAVTPTEMQLESASGRRTLTVKTVPGQRAPAAAATVAGGAAPAPAPATGAKSAGRPGAAVADQPLSPAAQARAAQLDARRRQVEERSAQRAAARAAMEAGRASAEPPAN